MERKHTPGCKCCDCFRVINDLVVDINLDGTVTTYTFPVDEPITPTFYKSWQIGCVGPVTRNRLISGSCLSSNTSKLRSFSFTASYPSASAGNPAGTIEFLDRIPNAKVIKTITGSFDSNQVYSWDDERFVFETLSCKYKGVSVTLTINMKTGACLTAAQIATAIQTSLRALNSPAGTFPELADVTVSVDMPELDDSGCTAMATYTLENTILGGTFGFDCNYRTEVVDIWGYLVELFSTAGNELTCTITRYQRSDVSFNPGGGTASVTNQAITRVTGRVGVCYSLDPFDLLSPFFNDPCISFCGQACISTGYGAPSTKICSLTGLERESILAKLTWTSNPLYSNENRPNKPATLPASPLNLSKVQIKIGAVKYTLDALVAEDSSTGNLNLGSNWPPSNRTRKLRSYDTIGSLEDYAGTFLWRKQTLGDGTIRQFTNFTANPSCFAYGPHIYPLGSIAISQELIPNVLVNYGFGITRLENFIQVFNLSFLGSIEFSTSPLGVITLKLGATIIFKAELFSVFGLCDAEKTLDRPRNGIIFDTTGPCSQLNYAITIDDDFVISSLSDVFVERNIGDVVLPISHGLATATIPPCLDNLNTTTQSVLVSLFE